LRQTEHNRVSAGLAAFKVQTFIGRFRVQWFKGLSRFEGSRGSQGFKRFKIQGVQILGFGRDFREPFTRGAQIVPLGGRPTPAAYRTDSVMPSMPKSRSMAESARPIKQ
jgi:hypothetical protein